MKPPKGLCSIEGCARKVHARGYCGTHYQRWRLRGDPHDPGTRGFAFEDSYQIKTKPGENGCIIWTGRINSRGYGAVTYKGKSTVAHRVIWAHSGRSIPGDMVLDHTCRNRACVNLEHLRLVTPAENAQNLSTLSPGTTTGWRNVYQNKKTGRYFCMVTSRGVTYRSDGQFSDLKSAVLAAVELRREHMPFVIEDEEAIKELMNGAQG